MPAKDEVSVGIPPELALISSFAMLSYRVFLMKFSDSL